MKLFLKILAGLALFAVLAVGVFTAIVARYRVR